MTDEINDIIHEDLKKISLHLHPSGDVSSLMWIDDPAQDCPALLRWYLAGAIQIETLMAFDTLFNCFVNWDTEILESNKFVHVDNTPLYATWSAVHEDLRLFGQIHALHLHDIDMPKFQRAIRDAYAPRSSYASAMTS